MGSWLKQSTAVTVKLGPFLDSTDGDTEEIALTIAQADILLSKNGGAFAQTNNVAGATHDTKGLYGVPLDTTDTNTLGELRVYIHESGALAVWETFMVVPANVWDSMFGADKLQTDVNQWNSVALATTNPLPNAAADGVGGLPISDAGGLDLDTKLANTNEVTAARMAALTDWINGGRLDLILDIIAADVVNIDGATMRGTNNAAPASALVTAQNDLDLLTGADGATLATSQPNYAPNTVVPDEAGVAPTAAEINAEVVDVLKTDTIAEIAQGTPTATPTFEEAIMYLYMMLRNKIDVDSGFKEFYNNAGTVIWKKALSDDGSNYVEANGETGP